MRFERDKIWIYVCAAIIAALIILAVYAKSAGWWDTAPEPPAAAQGEPK